MVRVHKSVLCVIAAVGLLGLAVIVGDGTTRGIVTAAPSAIDARQLSGVFREIARDAIPSIVAIETRGKASARGDAPQFDEESPFDDLFRQNPQFRDFFRDRQRMREVPTRGMGSGFVIDASGIVVTNSHVVRGADEVKVRFQDGQEFLATDVKMDDKSDVAVLRINGAKGLKALRFGDSDATEIGDWVLAFGNPFDVGVTVTAGIISAKSRGLGIADREDFLQTDAAINPGNSGGPLLNLAGEIIGVNTAISSRSGGSEGIGFAIPVNMVKWISQQLLTDGKVRRAYLGIGIQQLDSQLSKTLKVDGLEGAVITTIGKGSPAETAKLQEGDVIQTLNGRQVTNPRSLQNIVERLEVGKGYPISIVRDGKKMELSIVVREMPDDYLSAQSRLGGRRNPGRNPREETFNDLGVQVKDLTAEMAKELGYDEKTTGVVITNVSPDGPAASAGISAGFIIEKVGNKKIATIKDLDGALKTASLKEGVTLLINTPNGKRFIAIQ